MEPDELEGGLEPSASLDVDAEFPEALAFLFEPARYKVAYGGRGSGKSWGVARALLTLATMRPLRILCAREVQKSMKDSVHKLLSDQIKALRLEAFFDVLADEIRGLNGSSFVFAGLWRNVDNIKSKEGIDICWVEEARGVSKHSWDTLVPTIRKDGSEIWITFNPLLDTDETYKRFVLKPQPGSQVHKVNWSDNPWFTRALRAERDHLAAVDPDAALNVWEGHCVQVLDGAIYANELRAATAGGRIRSVPYDASKPVHTFWDLGRRDKTAIWFVQVIGFEIRVLDYFEDRGHPVPHYLKALQARGYVYGEAYLPHDAENELLGAVKTVAQQVREAGYRVRIVPRTSVASGISAARTLFGRAYFDEVKCADGLQCLRTYRYDVDPDTGLFSMHPRHDDSSHGADAWRYVAVGLKEPSLERAARPARAAGRGAGAWMR